jgi:Protein kinase domain
MYLHLIPVKKIEDMDLLLICAQPENENRGQLMLRKLKPVVEVKSPERLISPLDAGRIKKLQNFFGDTPSANLQQSATPRKSSLEQRATRAPMKSNKLRAFFGERPPDELIVDQLESFFPGLNLHPATSIKNIVKANLTSKRSSRPLSVIARRKSILEKFTSVGGKEVRDKKMSVVAPKNETPVQTSHLSEASTFSVGTDNSPTTPEFPDVEPQEQTGNTLENSIPRWERGRLIGQGGFGKVFHALNLDTGQMMAVKQVPLNINDKSSMKQKQIDALKREIELLKDLDYENVVQYLGYEITPNEINVFLEYVSGGSISSVLAQTGKFDQIYCQDFAAQILCGLDYLHQRTIIHRDIKGANILIDQHGVAKITDFGISKKNGNFV